MLFPMTFRDWTGDISRFFRADLVAGITLWAMMVPETVAHAKIANAPSAAAGLYCIIVAFPIYALFASSRYLVPSSTAALSATTAGILALMSSQPANVFSALILTVAVVYLLFAWLKLGFIADFISEPVSRGFMMGLAIYIIVGQLPKLFGVEKGAGNTLEKIWQLGGQIPQANWVTFIVGMGALCIMVGAHRVSKLIPGAMAAMIVLMLVFALTNVGQDYGIEMVGALPSGLPSIVMPSATLAEMAIIIPAAVGLVILGTSEAAVVASSLAIEHDQDLDLNQQFFALGVGNVLSGFVGGLMAAGSTSSTMVNSSAGAQTPMSLLWGAGITLLTLLFLTGLFAYLPEAFLAMLIIHAVWHLLKVSKLIRVRHFSKAEYRIALITLMGVLLFDVLYGLLIAMLVNALYYAYVTAMVKVEAFGTTKGDGHILVPLSFDDARPTPKHVLAFGLTQGQIFYASARSAFNQAAAIIKSHPEAKYIVISVARMSQWDFTSAEVVMQFEALIRDEGKKLYITDVHSAELLKQLQNAGLDPQVVDISIKLDIVKL